MLEVCSIANDCKVWNTHQRIRREIALAHVEQLSSLTPPITIASSYITKTETSIAPSGALDDLDTPDELAVRSLILGIMHRTLGDFEASRKFLQDAHKRHADAETKWIGGVALFELAVLDLKETEATDRGWVSSESIDGVLDGGLEKTVNNKVSGKQWMEVLKGASEKLDKAMAISGNSVDLSSRLDTRVSMLRDEIVIKKESLGLAH